MWKWSNSKLTLSLCLFGGLFPYIVIGFHVKCCVWCFSMHSRLLITQAHLVMKTRQNRLEIKTRHILRSLLQPLLPPVQKRLVLLMQPRRKIRRKIKAIKLVYFYVNLTEHWVYWYHCHTRRWIWYLEWIKFSDWPGRPATLSEKSE